MVHSSADRSEWAIDAVGTAGLVAIGVAVWFGFAAAILPAIMLLAGAIIIAAWSASAAVAACLVAAPTAFITHDLPWGRFSLLELAIVAACAGYALRSTVSGDVRGMLLDARSLARPVEVALPVVGFLCVAAVTLTTLANPEFMRQSVREVRLVLVEPVLFLCVARLTWRDPGARLWSAYCLVGTGVVLSLLAVGQLVVGNGGVVAGELTRATVTYPHPNNLALFLERSTIFTLGGLLAAPRSRWVWVLAGTQFLGVIATLSRGALVALFIGAVALLWWRGEARRLRLVGFGAVTVTVGLMVFARDRVLDAGGAGDEPTRFALWRSSLDMIRDFPVTGVGPDQFLYQYWRRAVEPAAWPERYTSHPHNLVLDIWLRLGAAGLAVAAWLAAGVAREVWRIRRSRAIDLIAPSAFAALVGGLAHGMVDNGFFLPDVAVLTWAFVGWLVTARGSRQ